MHESEKPRRIKQLPEHVVNKIAAGEILQRPSSAVKELVENSIDAKSTVINVTVQDAGFKLLQIQDNGSGIQKEDLKIICDRFTTSKLEQYKDLQSLTTHGFRGEALASISLVSSLLTIITKVANSDVAYKASYKEGKLCESIRPTAGNKGTQISIENIFFNMPLRRESLSNHNDEFHRISNLVTKYALHYYSVTFCLHKQGESASNDFRCNGTSTQKEKLGSIFGSSLAKDSMDFEISNCSELNFSCKGFVSRPCYVSKKYTFILFVNNRLVEFPSLKKALLNIYSVYLLKGNNPFIYLNVLVKGDEIDVNVHPTKEEVKMLHESEIIERVCKKVDQLLINSNSNQQFLVKTINPFPIAGNLSQAVLTPPRQEKHIGQQRDSLLNESVGSKSVELPYHMVRTDPTLQKLDPFLQKRGPSLGSLCSEPNSQNGPLRNSANFETTAHGGSDNDQTNQSFPEISANNSSFPPRRTFKLNSLLNLRKLIEDSSSDKMREIISNCTFVGSASPEIVFVQHATELWLVNFQCLCEQLFYQVIIYDFGNFGRFSFSSDSMTVSNLVELALRKSKKYKDVYSNDEEKLKNAVSEISEKFLSRSEMLLDYFSWNIDKKSGKIKSFPMLLRNFEPSFEILPELITDMGLKGVWNKEQECFDSFARIIAKYYAVTSRFWVHKPEKDWKYVHQHVLLPAMKLFLQPNSKYTQTFSQVASLSQLYKIFERC
ncbi:DNA mismatch repair protein Mlh1-like [Convolutriloba macropyga]|uniref:DNA mismatch repair protein Mlh1-like n=1 Tax=Convolutriloba macropyga TaxID=536237 RepID=UPI003F5208D6